MIKFIRYFLLALSLISNYVFATTSTQIELQNIIAKDPVSGATFEMKFLTTAEIKTLPSLAQDPELKSYFLKHKFYKLLTSNLPTDTIYSIYSINLENKATLINTFTTDNGSDLQPLQKEEGWNVFSDKCICINKNFLNGEPFSFKLVSKDSKTCLVLKYIPNPVEYKWENGASIHMEAYEGSGNLFTFIGTGFKPNEKLSMVSISGNEKCPIEFPADKTGSITIGMAPAVLGQKGGDAKFIVMRENGRNKAILNYFWGEKAYKNKG